MSAFPTAKDANRFFVQRILERAKQAGVSFSTSERFMLEFKLEDSDAEDSLRVDFERDHSMRGFEKTLRSLLQDVFESESASQPESAELWRDAHQVMSDDHYYLAGVIDPVLNPRLWSRLRSKLKSRR